jgi:hypothetical protein
LSLTYSTRYHAALSWSRYSKTPGTAGAIGRESRGFSPFCTLQRSAPRSPRTSSGKDLMTALESPSKTTSGGAPSTTIRRYQSLEALYINIYIITMPASAQSLGDGSLVWGAPLLAASPQGRVLASHRLRLLIRVRTDLTIAHAHTLSPPARCKGLKELVERRSTGKA